MNRLKEIIKANDAFYPSRVVLDNLVKEANRVNNMLADANDLKKLAESIKKTHLAVLKIKDKEEPSKARELRISKEYEKLRNSALYRKFDLDMYV